MSLQTAAGGPEAPQGVHMALEMIVLPVADAERSEALLHGPRLAARCRPFDRDGFRLVQVTPPLSPTSILFGEGVTTAAPGSIDRVLLVVDDVDAARAELLAHGAEVSEVFHGPGAGFRPPPGPREAGRDPEGRSYLTWATFEDPDGNGWVLQEIKERLPGREWATDATAGVSELAGCCTRPPSTTTTTRRPMRSTTGGTGTPPTWTPAAMATTRMPPCKRPTATCPRSSMSAPTSEPPDGEQNAPSGRLVVVAAAANEPEAELIRQRLEVEGIAAIVQRSIGSVEWGSSGSRYVYVQAGELERARALLGVEQTPS